MNRFHPDSVFCRIMLYPRKDHDMFFSKNHLKKQPLLNWLIPLLLGIVTSTGVFAQSDKTLQTPVQTVRPVVVDAIAAVVNNDVITIGELNERIQQIESRLKNQNITLPPREVLQKQVLEHMIVESAQIQLAKEMGLRIDDTQLDRTIARIAESKHVTLQQFQQQMEQNGIPFEKYRENVRNDITMQRLRDREVVNKIQINDAEVDHLLGADSQMQMPEQIRLGHILVRIPENASPEQIAEKRERAEKVLKILQSGVELFGRYAELVFERAEKVGIIRETALCKHFGYRKAFFDKLF